MTLWHGLVALGLALFEAGAGSMRSFICKLRAGSVCRLSRIDWLALVTDTVECCGAGEGAGGAQG